MYFAYSTTSKKKETRISYDATSKRFDLKDSTVWKRFFDKANNTKTVGQLFSTKQNENDDNRFTNKQTKQLFISLR